MFEYSRVLDYFSGVHLVQSMTLAPSNCPREVLKFLGALEKDPGQWTGTRGAIDGGREFWGELGAVLSLEHLKNFGQENSSTKLAHNSI